MRKVTIKKGYCQPDLNFRLTIALKSRGQNKKGPFPIAKGETSLGK